MPDARTRYPTPRVAQIRQREFVQRGEYSGAMIRRSRMTATASLLLVCGVGAFFVNCSRGQDETSPKGAQHDDAVVTTSMGSDQPIPEEYQAGEERFNALCARCHGVVGRGTDMGPPLVHKIYEPSHHADFTFRRAVTQGVRAHHWSFGPMPKISEATSDDVAEIIPYVRWLQRKAGIR